MEHLVERIRQIVERDQKDALQLLASLIEECGELGREIKIRHGVLGNAHKQSDEGIAAEAVDVIICGLCLFFSGGGTVNDLAETITRKLDKWDRSVCEKR